MTQNLPRSGSIEHWAQAKGGEVAVVEELGDSRRRSTWRRLNDQADALAHGLLRHGLERGAPVAVRTHVRTEWVVVAAALAKLGCSMVGVNWRLTPAETRHLLDNSQATALVCDDADLTDIEACRTAGSALKFVVSIDATRPGFLAYDELLGTPGEPLFSAGEPPLLIYTSGTTGLPKGVAVGQAAGVDPAVLREYRESMEGASASSPTGGPGVQLVTMPMHHASGPSQVWGALRKGRPLVLMRRFDPEATLAAIALHRVTVWAGVPTMFKRLAALPPQVLARHDVSSIQRVSVGAAPVPFALKRWILGHFGRLSLQENYGATEVGMVSSLSPEMQEHKPGSSGKPFRHVHIEIRDTAGSPLPAGEVGEIWVSTPVTIRQYLNTPPLDRETLDARGFFRVGDMGYLDADGYLFITDRAKDMIISGGVNIYPAEIETAFMEHPAVLDVAVIGIPDDEFGEQVLALCQLKPGHAASPAELLAHAAPRLASYKRPRRIEIVDDLPRNTMGKVLKRELRDPYWNGKERKV